MKNLSRVSSYLLKSNKRFLSSHTTNTQDALENFDALLQRRRGEAQRSIVVQVPAASCTEQVIRQCSAVGQISSCFHYTTLNENINKRQKLLLVEFSDPGCVQEMMLRVPTSKSTSMPVRSPFLRYREGSRDLTQASDRIVPPQSAHSPPPVTLAKDALSTDELKQNLFSCSSISEQMQLYYDLRKISDLGYRLRFMTCRQIELLLSGLLPHILVLPFGSSVNGFGHDKSDLDMVMQLEAPDVSAATSPQWAEGLEQHNPEDYSGEQRVCSTNILKVVSELLKSGAPGCPEVYKILQARVPIIKYEQQLTGLDCDLSANNWSGLYMSELLYMYSALDPRVRPLLFVLRLWAEEAGLTRVHAGRWITNFSLANLALFYLVHIGILPPYNLLRRHARPEDERVDEKGMTCTYLRSLSVLTSLHQQPDGTRSLTLEDLLYGFFCFYDKFHFNKHGLTIFSGEIFNKPEGSALYIQNPLDGSLNVSRNVTLEEVENFAVAVTQACFTLVEDAPQSTPQWGLLTLLSTRQRSKLITRINLKEIVDGCAPPSTAIKSTAPPSARATSPPAAAGPRSGGKSQQDTSPQSHQGVSGSPPKGPGKHTHNSPPAAKNVHRKNSSNGGSGKRKGRML